MPIKIIEYNQERSEVICANKGAYMLVRPVMDRGW